MKHPLRIAVVLAFVAVFVRPGNGCGPLFYEYVFSNPSDPDVPYAKYIGGRIGLVGGTYRVRHLVIAYNTLSGRGLSPAEQKAAQQAEDYYTGGGDSANTVGESAAGERKVPGSDWETFDNCPDAARANAERTLADRRAHYGNSPDVANWEAGQEAVFSNCNGPGHMPDAAPSSAALWLRQDRAYQIAAAQFYALDYDAALASFRAIAADHASPWAPLARYLEARTFIRNAIVPYHPFGLVQGATQQQVQAQQEQVRAGLGQARDQLESILHDPAMKSLHSASSHLLDYVMIRLDPLAQADVLARRLTASQPGNSDQAARDYLQNVIDLTYIYNSLPTYSPWSQYKAVQVQADKSPPAPFIRWMNDMGRARPRVAGVAASGTALDRSNDALESWRSTHAAQWLLAALVTAQPGQPESSELIGAARQVPTSSPAYAGVTYERLRLEAAPAQPEETISPSTQRVYAELRNLMPDIERSEPRSTFNTFADLASNLAPTLQDYVRNTTRIAVGSSSDDINDFEPPSTPTHSIMLCAAPVDTPDAYHFDKETATVINQRMPLSMLKDAALLPYLPANARFELAHMVWTRAVLLDAPDIAHALTPYLSGCQPAIAPWLKQYDDAKTPDERRVLGLLALMRFTSTEPTVRVGEERDFAAYDDFRDNWWCSAEAQPWVIQQTAGKTPPHLFATEIVPRLSQPDPPFLTATDRAEADKEIARLQQIPCASDYFAREALAWVKNHPDDAHDADVVGFAMRVVRNACRSTDTKDFSHQLFDLLHQRFPKSEWATKYTTWE
jgi:hypothetical protein